MSADADTCISLFEYLKTINITALDELYEHPPTCLIVFRELNELPKHFVLRLLFLEQAISKSIVAAWVSKGSENILNKACTDLTDLRIWQSMDGNNVRGSWRLNRKFQESLKVSLFGGGRPLMSDCGSLTAEKHPKDAEFLDNYASERWDSILHFMIAPDTAEVGICVQKVLLASGLIKRGGSNSSIGITQRGFQFLLMDRPLQVLRFILHYFEFLKNEGLDLVDSLKFIFQMSFLSIGKSYPTEMLSPAQQNLLQHMRELGLAYQRKRTAPRFYITRLALSLAFGSSSSSRNVQGVCSILTCGNDLRSTASHDLIDKLPTGVTDSSIRSANSSTPMQSSTHEETGFILVETNFRIYAYTDSPLRTALLSLFSKIHVRYPNLVVADITRESVREALIRGISADQIINFLKNNAHPDMLCKTPILPSTLVDQIRLWELERDRLLFQEGCLYEQFSKNIDFEMVRDFAKNQRFLLWECPERRLMVVSKDGHEAVRKFWRQNRPG